MPQYVGQPVLLVDAAGNPYAAAANTVDREVITLFYVASAGGTGYSIGDQVVSFQLWDVTTNPATFLSAIWQNVTQGTTISAPTLSNLTYLGGNTATAAKQDTGNASLSAIDTKLGTINGKLPSIGPQTSANSQSVTFATDDADIGAIGTGLSAPTGGSGMLGYLSGIYAGGKEARYIQGSYANATNVDLITGNSTSGNPANSWTDVTGWDYFVATIMTDASGSGISVLLEGTNDTTNEPAGGGLLSMDPTSTSFAASQTTASLLGASAFQRRFGPLPFRYIRLRVSALTAGQVRATIQLRRGALPGMLNNGVGAPTTGIQAAAPSTSSNGVTSTFRVVSAASNNATSVKGSAGSLVSVWVGNNSASWRYVKWYNKATAGTPGTDTSIQVIPLPPGWAGFIEKFIYHRFSTGISFAIVAGIAESDNTSIGANEVVISGTYA